MAGVAQAAATQKPLSSAHGPFHFLIKLRDNGAISLRSRVLARQARSAVSLSQMVDLEVIHRSGVSSGGTLLDFHIQLSP
jgi:hypothetical protein